MRKSFLFLPICVLLLKFANAQVPAENKHINLGPNVNSTASELRPFITIDGKALYMIRDHHPRQSNICIKHESGYLGVLQKIR